MYRNAYLDIYKNSVMDVKNIQQLIMHFTQIYTTLGSVLQDLQYQVGVIIYSQSKKNNQPPQKNLFNNNFNKDNFEQNKKNTFGNSCKLLDDYQNQQKKKQKYSTRNQNNRTNNQLNRNFDQHNRPSNQNNRYSNQIFPKKQEDKSNQIQEYTFDNNPMSTQQFNALFLDPIPTKQTKIMNQNKKKDLQYQKYSTNPQRKSNKEVDYLDQIFNNAKK